MGILFVFFGGGSMFGKIRTTLFSLTVIAVLIFSAIGPTIVYADDGTPPDATAPHTIDSNDDADKDNADKCDSNNKEGKNKDKKGKKNKSGGKHSNKCNSDEETADANGSEGDSGTADSATDVSGGGDSSQEASTAPADLLSQVPENTSVTVLNADGQPEPLVTQAAADAIATTTDPIWCPQGVVPNPGLNNCTPSFSSFTLLLSFLAANAATYTGAGTIYVEQGTYGGGESVIDFNAYNLSNISSSDLTVQGGWDTTPNPVDPATASTSNFSVPIIIGSSTNPWGGSLTLNNIQILSPQNTGITLYSQNNINLGYVTVENSASGDGAVLNAGANVTVNKSHFLRNNMAGARITAGLNVAVADSEFSNPFNQRRQITGLEITSGGSTSLANVLAIGNRRRGVDIAAGGAVTIGGDTGSVFSETNGLNGGVFYGFGLQVITPDVIQLTNVTANNNFLWGALLDAGGDVAISNSFFNANSTDSPTFIDDTGLIVISGGDVALSGVTANDNRLIGAVIDAAGTVLVNDSNFLNNQGTTTASDGTTTLHGLGLQVSAGNIVSLNNVTASGNSLFGAYLESSAGEVIVNNSTFSNNGTVDTPAPYGSGLEIVSAGNASIANTILDNNQTYGASIQAGPHVFLDLLTTTNNGTDGVQVQAACTHLNGGTYSGNAQYGLNLTTSALDLVAMPAFANNTAGDIFPATPATCPPVVIITPPLLPGSTSSPQGSVTNGNSSDQQTVSFIANTGNGVSGTSLINLSLNGMFGITREATADAVVTSIFVGNYVYVYTIYNVDAEPSLDNLQIIALSPAPVTGVAMVGP
jgi:hypothetical protein